MKLAAGLRVLAAIGGVTLSWADPAAADGWPPSVAGNWTVRANLSWGTMLINQPVSAGQCKPISGTIAFGNVRNPIEGAYCPGSGRITFFRYLNTQKTVSQFYSANLSQNASNLNMAGSFTTRPDSGSPGEYSFYATE